MKLHIERKPLIAALAHIASVVERRNTMPILAHVLLSAQADGLRLKATDLDIEIIETVAADVSETGGRHRVGAHALRHRAQAPRGWGSQHGGR